MLLISLLEKSESLLSELKGGEKAVFRFRRGGMLIQALNLTQGGPRGKESGKGDYSPFAPAHVRVFVGGDFVDLPILYSNTPFGVLKNRVTDFLFDYYSDNKREVLEHIYDVDAISREYRDVLREASEISGREVKPDWVSVLSASLFRMKPPMLGVAFSSHSKRSEILRLATRVTWLNPLFKFWGIGISTWGPSRSVTSSIAIPVINEFRVISREAERIREGVVSEFPDLREELVIPNISISDLTGIDTLEEIETVEGTLRGFNLINGVKLRLPLDPDYRRLGYKVTEDMRHFPVKNDKKGKSSDENKFDIVTATPVRQVYSGPITLVSIFSPGTRTGRHTLTEIASFATALREVDKLGSNDNVMRIYSYFEFENVKTGEILRLSTVSGFGERKENENVRKLASHFEEKFGNLDYHKIITPLSIGLLTVHLGEGGN